MPAAIRNRFQEIQELADSTRAAAGAEGMYPVPLAQITRQLGFRQEFFEGTDSIAGAIDYQQGVIWISKDDSPVRQNFTWAHEIGHAVLHRDAGDIVDY